MTFNGVVGGNSGVVANDQSLTLIGLNYAEGTEILLSS
jgi:hypothetical protein